MTSESTTPTTPETEAEGAAARQRFREKLSYDLDIELGLFLHLVLGADDDKHDQSANISLVTSGGIIHGKAVTHKRYSDAQIADVAATSEWMGETMRIVRDDLVKLRAELKESRNGEPAPSRRYVNFLNASVVHGSVAREYGHLRVDLTSVIGWSLEAPKE